MFTNTFYKHHLTRKAVRTLLFFLFICLAILSSGVAAEEPDVLLVYPQTNSSYGKVIELIVRGIEKSNHMRFSKYEINAETTVSQIDKVVNNKAKDVVISLGRYALNIINKSSPSIPVIAGATLLNNDDQMGISLIGDPVEFMSMLKHIAPKVKRVHVVYNRHNSEWYINKSIAAANSRGIILKAYQADNLNKAAVLYKEIMNKLEGGEDAVWILMDRVVPQNAILPAILKHAWDKGIVTFSSNPAQVKQGVLFALYPSYEKIGNDLAELAGDVVSRRASGSIYPATATGMKTSINSRTASHLNLSISPLQLEKFDSVFPAH